MNQLNLQDKQIALLIWNTEKEDDAHIYIGKIAQIETGYYFVNESKGWNLELDNEQLSRATPVSEDMKDIFLNADYFISLSMRLIGDENTDDYIPTGLKW